MDDFPPGHSFIFLRKRFENARRRSVMNQLRSSPRSTPLRLLPPLVTIVSYRFFEFFTANICNPNTRRAYGRWPTLPEAFGIVALIADAVLSAIHGFSPAVSDIGQCRVAGILSFAARESRRYGASATWFRCGV